MPEIEVSRADVGHMLSRFLVRITDENDTMSYVVMLSAADFKRLGGGYSSPEEFIRACFDFLLDREPKESILSSFDVSQIGDYFPEFEATIVRR